MWNSRKSISSILHSPGPMGPKTPHRSASAPNPKSVLVLREREGGALRGARSTALPPVKVWAEGVGTAPRPGTQTAATLAAKFRGFETR
jgi:hypothetical protein